MNSRESLESSICSLYEPPKYHPDHKKDVLENVLKVENKLGSNDNKYKLFCGLMHVKTGTLTIGILDVLIHIVCFIGAIVYAYTNVSSWKTIICITTIFLIIYIPTYACFFVALFTKIQFLFSFYLFIAGLRLLIFVILVDAMILIMALSLNFGDKKDIVVHTILFAVFAIVSSLVQIRWMWIVIKCMKYFRDIKRENQSDIVLKY